MEPISNFKGLFSRGEEDNTPEDHFMDALNVEYPFAGVQTRKPFEVDLAIAEVRRIFMYKRLNESPRLLILTAGGDLYDSTNPFVPIITIAGMTDFSAVVFYNRAYISPHDGNRGLVNETVRVYDGTTIRVAGGSQPTGSMTAVNSASSGKVEAGTHLLGVVFESPSGQYSKIGPVIFASVLATGAKQIDLSGIPTGPSGTVRRRIVATHAIPDYDGNQFAQEYFFIPNGVIENNVATTASVDFYDSELSDSADYLFTIRETIPAGLMIGSYKGRMLVGNINSDSNLVLVSKVNEPETFDEADDLIVVDPTEPGGVTNSAEHHGLLVLMKEFRSYTTNDNGAEPSTWEVLPFDKSIGTTVHGIATILDATGTNIDRFLMASHAGLVLYDGTFREPELTFKIDNYWQRINKSAFNTIQAAVDPINKKIYIAAPFDESTIANYIIYGDYSDGLSYENIKWSLWVFPFACSTVIIDLVDKLPIVKIGSLDAGNVYKQDPDGLNDIGSVAILNYVHFGLLPRDPTGTVKHFNWFKVKMIGAGNVTVTTRGQNGTNPQTYNSFALAAGARMILRKLNFEGEKCSLKLQLNALGAHFTLTSFELNSSDKYQFTPQ